MLFLKAKELTKSYHTFHLKAGQKFGFNLLQIILLTPLWYVLQPWSRKDNNGPQVKESIKLSTTFKLHHLIGVFFKSKLFKCKPKLHLFRYTGHHFLAVITHMPNLGRFLGALNLVLLLTLNLRRVEIHGLPWVQRFRPMEAGSRVP